MAFLTGNSAGILRPEEVGPLIVEPLQATSRGNAGQYQRHRDQSRVQVPRGHGRPHGLLDARGPRADRESIPASMSWWSAHQAHRPGQDQPRAGQRFAACGG